MCWGRRESAKAPVGSAQNSLASYLKAVWTFSFLNLVFLHSNPFLLLHLLQPSTPSDQHNKASLHRHHHGLCYAPRLFRPEDLSQGSCFPVYPLHGRSLLLREDPGEFLRRRDVTLSLACDVAP